MCYAFSVNKPLTLGQIISVVLACLLLLALFVFGSLYGTPYTESWVTGISFITLCMLAPVLFFGGVVYSVRKGRNPNGTLIPQGQKMVGLVFVTVVLVGSLVGLFTMTRLAIDDCMSKSQQYGYKFRERSVVSGKGTSYIAMRCVNSSDETIFHSSQW
jgi:hypothetical protein